MNVTQNIFRNQYLKLLNDKILNMFIYVNACNILDNFINDESFLKNYSSLCYMYIRNNFVKDNDRYILTVYASDLDDSHPILVDIFIENIKLHYDILDDLPYFVEIINDNKLNYNLMDKYFEKHGVRKIKLLNIEDKEIIIEDRQYYLTE